jgi:hypothetical protein
MKKLTLRLFIALLTFVIGVTSALAWVFFRIHLRNTVEHTEPSVVLRSEPTTAPPVRWKRVEVEGKANLYIPQDMMTGTPLGDSDDYRSVYQNANMRITIIYGKSNSCATSEVLAERSSYPESFVEVDGRKARLGVDGFYKPGVIAYFCVPPEDRISAQLEVNIMCKDDHALEQARRVFASIEFKNVK